MKTSFDFKGSNVFVFGGTSGINLGIAEGFARAGARVAVLSRSQDKVDAAVARLEALGALAMGFSADVREYEPLAATLAATATKWGPIDVLVSGAAGNFPALAKNLSPNGFKAVVDIDLRGTYNVTKAAFEAYLRQHGGHIVNISAPFQNLGVSLQAHVAAAKAGVDALTRTCAVEFGPYGIRVNSIAPGATLTPFTTWRLYKPDGTLDQEAYDAFVEFSKSQSPLRIVGEPIDQALLIHYLLCDASRYSTGNIFRVNGGQSMPW